MINDKPITIVHLFFTLNIFLFIIFILLSYLNSSLAEG